MERGGGARTRDENFLRGAEAGWEILSSVRDTGKGAKRPQKSSRNVQLHSETHKSEILQGVGKIPSSEKTVKALVWHHFRENFLKI